jgi:3-(3-hydroxy-phenyl)propionate hydroxylase
MQRFRHDRCLFVGDAAHQVSPFGARGANSGVQDTANLAWKLALVLGGQAPEALLDSYSAERTFAADENIMNSTRSTDFITPKSSVSRTFRNAVLQLAGRHAFARRLVNSGRLSVPSVYVDSPLNTPDVDRFAGDMVPGAPLDDAPVEIDGQPAWLLDQLGGRFQLLVYVERAADLDARALAELKTTIPVEPVLVTARPGGRPGLRALHDARGRFLERYDALPGSAWLVRPDQHVAARWRRLEPGAVRAALARATCT